MKRDESIRWVDPPKLGMLGKSYLMLFIKGLTTALRHLFLHKKITLQSPEQRHEVRDPVNYRGVHRLNKDEQGRVKCVACFLCATACPAHCIDIVAEPSPWPDREKYPKVFNIDELRCIFCGMCEQACPVEAIELTSFYDLTGSSREEMIFDKEKLLSVFDQTKDREPMPSKRCEFNARQVENLSYGGRHAMISPQETLAIGTVLAAVGIWWLLPGSGGSRAGHPAMVGLRVADLRRTLGGFLAVVGFGCIGRRCPSSAIGSRWACSMPSPPRRSWPPWPRSVSAVPSIAPSGSA